MREAPPLILGIEITNPSAGAGCGVALHHAQAGWTDVEPLRAAPAGGRGGHDDDLMPAIDRLFTRRGATPNLIGRVVVSTGPGGYTSLRIACAAAKMIACAAGGGGARCVAVPTALVVARRVSDEAWSRGGVAVALAAKAQGAWVQVVDRAAAGARPGRIIGADDLAELARAGVRTLVADRHLPESMRRAAAGLEIWIIEPRFDPAALLEIPVGDGGLPLVDPVELAPLYPREPEAVTIWRQRRTGQPAPPGGAARSG